eukprot:2266666-Amphidinium_carterae.1
MLLGKQAFYLQSPPFNHVQSLPGDSLGVYGSQCSCFVPACQGMPCIVPLAPGLEGLHQYLVEKGTIGSTVL